MIPLALLANTIDWKKIAWDALTCPIAWALLTAVIALWLLIPRGASSTFWRSFATLLAMASGVLFTFAMQVPRYPETHVVFWLLSMLALGSGVAMICSRNPVYSALWFAASLVGASGLLLMQGAQFLGMATIVVYAGAIVVTFLFVIMLAKPEGHAAYDRLSWGTLPKPAAIFSAAILVGVILGAMGKWENHDAKVSSRFLIGGLPASQLEAGVMNKNHMAHLGRELFSRQLIAVEVAGTLLMAALVGAIAIAIHGKAVATREAEGASS